MKKLSIAAKSAAATALVAATVLAAPVAALANDGMGYHSYLDTHAQQQSTYKAPHYEGEAVTIGDDWGVPVYAEWHQGASGRWWATFWTYNYTYVYAAPAQAGCGWTFHCYDPQGNFVQIVRCEESATHGQVGPQGVSSHWQELDGTRWF